VLKEILEEAQAVMQKCSKKSSWWTNIRSLFPGSELSQIKELNEKLRNTASLMNFSINTATTLGNSQYQDSQNSSGKKPLKKKKAGHDDVMFSETLAMPEPDDFTKETQPFTGFLTETAFSLEFFGTKEYEGIAKKCDINHMFATWSEPELKISRTMFSEFPKSVITFISKDHTVIRGKYTETNTDSQSSLTQKAPSQSSLTQKPNSQISVTQKPSSKRNSLLKPELERADTKKLPISKFSTSDPSELVMLKDPLKKLSSKRESLNSQPDTIAKKCIKQAVNVKEENEKESKKEENKKERGKEEEVFLDAVRGTDPEEEEKEEECIFQKRRTSSSGGLQSPPDSFFMTAPEEFQYLDTRVETFEIVDTSSNGTYLNGKKLKKGEVRELKSGDIIGIFPKVTGSKDPSKEFSIGYIFRDGR